MDGGKSFRYLSSATSKAGCKRNLEEKEDRGEDGVGQGGGGGEGVKRLRKRWRSTATTVTSHSYSENIVSRLVLQLSLPPEEPGGTRSSSYLRKSFEKRDGSFDCGVCPTTARHYA